MTAAADTRPDSGVSRSAEALRDLAARHAAGADLRREPADEVVGALRSHGFARHFVPALRGGAEGTFGELTEAVITVGEGCAASAWLASLGAHAGRFAAFLPEDGQAVLWGGGPDTLVAAGLPPAGRAVPVAGGWSLTGRWAYVSGAASADWILLCAAAQSGDGPPALRFFAVPRGSYTVHETWDSIGMRGTGSHTVTTQDLLVPGHLSFARTALLTGANPHSGAAAHNVPFRSVAGLAFVAPVVGAARGALAAFAELTTGKRRTAHTETVLVRASGAIDAAHGLVRQNAEALDNRLFAPALQARGERNAACAAELAADAVTSLIRGAGTRGFSEAGPLQRFWRDVLSATSHVALQYETSARQSYAETLLGPDGRAG